MCAWAIDILLKKILDNNINYFIMKYHIMLGQFMETDTNYEYANLNCGRTLAQKKSPKFFLAYFFFSLRLSFSNRASLISFLSYSEPKLT